MRPDATALREAGAATLGLGPSDLCTVLRAGLDFWEGHRRNEDTRREALVGAAEAERDKAAEALRKMTAALEQEKLTSRKLQAQIAQLHLGRADIEKKYAEKARAARKVADLYVDLKKVHHRLRTDLLEAKHSCGGEEIEAAERAHNAEARKIHTLLPPQVSTAAAHIDAVDNGADGFVAEAGANTAAANTKAREHALHKQNERKAMRCETPDSRILARQEQENVSAEPHDQRRMYGQAAGKKAPRLSYEQDQNFDFEQSPAGARRPPSESNFGRSRALHNLEQLHTPSQGIERISKSQKRQRRPAKLDTQQHQRGQLDTEESPRSGIFESSPPSRGRAAHSRPAHPVPDRAYKRRRKTHRPTEGPSPRNCYVTDSPRARVFDLNPGIRKRHDF